jgi:hypothetical protein
MTLDELKYIHDVLVEYWRYREDDPDISIRKALTIVERDISLKTTDFIRLPKTDVSGNVIEED